MVSVLALMAVRVDIILVILVDTHELALVYPAVVGSVSQPVGAWKAQTVNVTNKIPVAKSIPVDIFEKIFLTRFLSKSQYIKCFMVSKSKKVRNILVHGSGVEVYPASGFGPGSSSPVAIGSDIDLIGGIGIEVNPADSFGPDFARVFADSGNPGESEGVGGGGSEIDPSGSFSPDGSGKRGVVNGDIAEIEVSESFGPGVSADISFWETGEWIEISEVSGFENFSRTIEGFWVSGVSCPRERFGEESEDTSGSSEIPFNVDISSGLGIGIGLGDDICIVREITAVFEQSKDLVFIVGRVVAIFVCLETIIGCEVITGYLE